MAKKNQGSKELQGWVKNNVEVSGAYHFHLGTADITPDAFIKISPLDPYTRGMIPEFINRGFLIYTEDVNNEPPIQEVAQDNKFTRIVTLRDGSKMTKPYADADYFVNMPTDKISAELHEIDDLSIVKMYKEKAEQLLKPKRIVDEFDMRIREINDKR
jgi:hypothetical protein